MRDQHRKLLTCSILLVACWGVAGIATTVAADLDPVCSIRCVDVSGNGEFIAIGWANNVGLFHRDHDEPLWIHTTTGFVDSVVLSDDGQKLAVAYNDPPYPYGPASHGHVAFFDTAGPMPLWSYTTDYAVRGVGRRALDMTRDGALIVAGTSVWPPPSHAASVGTVYVWDTASPVPVFTSNYPKLIMSVRLSGNGEYFAVGTYWWSSRLYHVASQTYCTPQPRPSDPAYSVALDHDATYVATGHGWAHQVNLYNNFCTRSWWSGTGGTHSSLVMDDAGTCLFASQYDDTRPPNESAVRFYAASSGTPMWVYDTGADGQTTVDMARDCGLMVSGGLFGDVHLFDYMGAGPIVSHNIGERVIEVAMSADGAYYAAASLAGYLYLITTVGEPEVVWSWKAPCPVTLCHVPPGKPENAHTITVGENAANAHLDNHLYDYLGACVGDASSLVAESEGVVGNGPRTLSANPNLHDQDPTTHGETHRSGLASRRDPLRDRRSRPER